MSTVPIDISTEQLLQAVERLPSSELDAFAARVNALRTSRAMPRLSSDETTLLLRINHTQLDPALQSRFDLLVTKRQAETISNEELQELIEMTDQIEQHDVERLEAIRDLAQLRGVTLGALMDTLNIKVSAYG